MLKIENVDIYGWEAAIRGMRNPMNSWDKSDSGRGNGRGLLCKDCKSNCQFCSEDLQFTIGLNDYKLMQNLCKGGSEESKWRRFVHVTCDITAPLYFYKELDTYRAGVEKNSCSTMHKIHAKEFTRDDFSCDKLLSADEYFDELPNGLIVGDFDKALEVTIMALNDARELYLQTKDKKFWYQMIQLLPSSYNQRRTYEFNYESLANIYRQRKNHKLDCWRDFCKWTSSLPYSQFITLSEGDINGMA